MSRRTVIVPRAVVFDFDLTLADSVHGFVVSHHFAAQELGLAPLDRRTIARSIGTPLERIVPMLYPGIEPSLTDEYIRVYRARAAEVMAGLTFMLPGACDTVRLLHDTGIALAIVSQKLRRFFEDVLRREGILDCFDVVLGGEDVPEYKPDPRGLLLALQRLDVTPADAVYVGDTVIDAETAGRAGMPFVGVLTGVTTGEELAATGTATVLDSVQELPGYFGL